MGSLFAAHRLVLLLAILGLFFSLSVARADSPTPETIAVTPDPTAVQVNPTPEPTFPVTVTREHSTPIITIGPGSVASPTPQATSSEVAGSRSGKTATPLPAPAATAAASISWPSPAQLRIDARLRWGKKVPNSVHRWAYLIVPTAHKYGVDPNLVAAVMTMESGGDPLALSASDAHGLMQVVGGPWDPAQNIDVGVHMLDDLHAEFGTWTLALAAYNAGPGAVDEYDGVPPYRETRDYVIIVRYLWALYAHRVVTSQEQLRYRNSVSDLRRFKDQRKKVSRLAGIGHIRVFSSVSCRSITCPDLLNAPPTLNLDPFWLDQSVPDPLQQVGPSGGVAASASN